MHLPNIMNKESKPDQGIWGLYSFTILQRHTTLTNSHYLSQESQERVGNHSKPLLFRLAAPWCRREGGIMLPQKPFLLKCQYQLYICCLPRKNECMVCSMWQVLIVWVSGSVQVPLNSEKNPFFFFFFVLNLIKFGFLFLCILII